MVYRSAMHSLPPLALAKVDEELIVEGTVNSSERVNVGKLSAKVEAGAPGVIEKDSQGYPSFICQKEGDAFIDWIGRFLKTISIGIPEIEGLLTAVEGAGLVAKTKIVLI